MPIQRRSRDARRSDTSSAAAGRGDAASGGRGNAAAADRLRTGDSTSTTGELDIWGAAVTDDKSPLAPYFGEIVEGQVALPGQRDGVVGWMQAALQRLGYPAQQSQIFDADSVSALREWQRLNGVATTGEFGPTSLGVMERAIEASFNLQQFKENAPGVPESTLREYLPHLNATMLRAGINSDARKAVFIAQIGHESDGFNTLEEYASGASYEGRADLGNVHAGDGRRFKGRGPIQITGRANYDTYGSAIGEDLIENPELAATTEIGFKLASEYWTRNGLNRFADRGQFDTVTARINGGQNGRTDRRNRWARAQRTMRDWAQTPPVVTLPRHRPGDLDTQTGEGGGAGPQVRSAPDPGPLDSVFHLLAGGQAVEAMADAERIATAAVEDEAALDGASSARDIARALLDAQEAFDDDRFSDSKQSARDAAVGARALRDGGLVNGNHTDPVIALAGRYWTRANEAHRSRGRGADIALVEAAAPLRRGDRGDGVAALQRLIGMDVAGGAGTFGPATERAVLRFQAGHGLAADGIVGAGTIAKLGT